jgi:hypothetical protein
MLCTPFQRQIGLLGQTHRDQLSVPDPCALCTPTRDQEGTEYELAWAPMCEDSQFSVFIDAVFGWGVVSNEPSHGPVYSSRQCTKLFCSISRDYDFRRHYEAQDIY